jgi:hypothetical protein
LIRIHSHFSNLNNNYNHNNFIIFTDGGYDGQFFYYITRFLFDDRVGEEIPYLDSAIFRMKRIGMPILLGLINYPNDFRYYSEFTFVFLTFFHLLSFLILHISLSNETKYLSYYFLFSPFSLHSNLLLVSDGLLGSIFIIYFITVQKLGLNIFNKNRSYMHYSISSKIDTIFVIFTISLLFLLIKETAFIFILIVLYYSFIQENKIILNTSLFVLIMYGLFLILLNYWIPDSKSIYPTNNLELLDYPFYGFIKSINWHHFLDNKLIFKELNKILLFSFHLSLVYLTYQLINIKSYIDSLPIIFILILGMVGDSGYWLSYDNSIRFYVVILPYLILLKNQIKNLNIKLQLFFIGFIFIGFLVKNVFGSPLNYSLENL